jgi:hypothetical protein
MFNNGRYIGRMLAVAAALLASGAMASAQDVIIAGYSPSTVTYYQPVRPVVAYSTYSAPVVAYGYRMPVVSYYAAPAVSYYPAAVRTTRYGIFGQPRRSTTYYPGIYMP